MGCACSVCGVVNCVCTAFLDVLEDGGCAHFFEANYKIESGLEKVQGELALGFLLFFAARAVFAWFFEKKSETLDEFGRVHHTKISSGVKKSVKMAFQVGIYFLCVILLSIDSVVI